MQTKFTPGPWEWVPGECSTDEHNTHRELVVVGLHGDVDSICYHGADWPMDGANGRLIAAAPELYAKLDSAESRLTAVLSIVRQFCKVTGEETLLAACEANGGTEDLRAALAKVNG